MKTISATSYTMYNNCPQQWRFNYILHLLKKEGKALKIGKIYHECLELFHSGTPIEEVLRAAEAQSDKEDFALIEMLFDKYIKNPVEGNVIETEYRFSIDIPGLDIPLYGFIDRIDEDKGVEYKSTSKKWKDADADNIQTDIYLYALLKKFGKPMPIVYSVNNKKTKVAPQIITISKTKEEIISIEERLIKFVSDVNSKTFDPIPGGYCFYCPWGNKLGDGTCLHSK